MSIVINGMKIEDSTVFEYKSNPKRPGSKANYRYEIYQTATNLTDYNKLCEPFAKYGKADLRYDTEKGHLILLGTDGEAMTPNIAVDTRKTTVSVAQQIEDMQKELQVLKALEAEIKEKKDEQELNEAIEAEEIQLIEDAEEEQDNEAEEALEEEAYNEAKEDLI